MFSAKDLEHFVNGYITAAIWASNDDVGTPLDDKYDKSDLAPEARAKMRKDCESFLERAGHLITPETRLGRISIEEGYTIYDYAGHDFWLTRNHHGCGFWEDHDWEAEAGEKLTKLSHEFGERDLYVGDDGLIHESYEWSDK